MLNGSQDTVYTHILSYKPSNVGSIFDHVTFYRMESFWGRTHVQQEEILSVI